MDHSLDIYSAKVIICFLHAFPDLLTFFFSGRSHNTAVGSDHVRTIHSLFLVFSERHIRISAVQAVTCSHPTLVERAASGNASGRCILWAPESLMLE